MSVATIRHHDGWVPATVPPVPVVTTTSYFNGCVFSWPASNADYYELWRNGVLVDTVQSNEATVMVSFSGTYTGYIVKAINAAGTSESVEHYFVISSTFTSPEDLLGVSHWFKADSLSLTNGASVERWPAAGGTQLAGQVLQRAQGAVFPTFQTNVGFGNKPVVRWPGAVVFAGNHAMYKAQSQYAERHAAVQGQSQFLAFRNVVTGSQKTIQETSGRQNTMVVERVSSGWRTYGFANSFLTSTNPTTTGWKFLSAVNTLSPGNQRIVVDGVATTISRSWLEFSNIAQISLGGAVSGSVASGERPWDGDIAEWIYLDHAAPVRTETAILAYLETRWNGTSPVPISVATPSTFTSSADVITLDASASYDSDDGIATRQWSLIRGPRTGTFSSPTSATTTFTPGAVDTPVQTVQVTDAFTATSNVALGTYDPGTDDGWSQLNFDYHYNNNYITSSAAIATVHADIDAVATTSTTYQSNFWRSKRVPYSREQIVRLQVKVNSIANVQESMFACARMSPNSIVATTASLYAAGYKAGEGWQIVKFVEGVRTILVTGAMPTAGTIYNIEFRCLDAEKSLYVDGVLAATHTDNEITQVGRMGLSAPRAVATPPPAWVDNFQSLSLPINTNYTFRHTVTDLFGNTAYEDVHVGPDALLLSNTAEGGVHGSSVLGQTNIDSTGGLSGDPFDDYGFSTGATLTYSNARVRPGSTMSMQHTSSTGANAYLTWEESLTHIAPLHVISGRVYMNAATLYNTRLINLRDSYGQQQCGVGVLADFRLAIRDYNTDAIGISTTLLPEDSWFRLEWKFNHYSQSAEVRIFLDAESTTPTEVVTATDLKTQFPFSRVDIGVHAIGNDIWMDDYAVGYDWLGPTGTWTPPGSAELPWLGSGLVRPWVGSGVDTYLGVART